MFSPLDILLGAGGILVAAAIAAPFLLMRRCGSTVERGERGARPAPVAAPVPQELHRRVS